MTDKLNLTNEIKEIKLGKSFGKNEHPCFHTFRYDFMPASVDTSKRATVDIGEGNQVTVTVPHIEGSGTDNTIFKGCKKPYQKECVIIIDHNTGEITLEKLGYNVQLKKTRAEGRNKPRSTTPVESNFNNKKSPSGSKLSPQQKSQPSFFSQTSPLQKCSPLPKSPVNNQPSPTNNVNPSMQFINMLKAGPSNQNDKNKGATTATNEVPEVGVLSSSDSSDSSSGEESDSESSENEENATTEPMQITENNNNQMNSHVSTKPSNYSQPVSTLPSTKPNNFSQPINPLPSMPKFSQLSEDLKLSDSDSD